MTEYINSDLICRTALWDAIRNDVAPFNVGMVCRHIHKAPAVEVVRCKDCKKWEADGTYEFDSDGIKRMWGACSNSLHHCKENHFCSYGERREDE